MLVPCQRGEDIGSPVGIFWYVFHVWADPSWALLKRVQRASWNNSFLRVSWATFLKRFLQHFLRIPSACSERFLLANISLPPPWRFLDTRPSPSRRQRLSLEVVWSFQSISWTSLTLEACLASERFLECSFLTSFLTVSEPREISQNVSTASFQTTFQMCVATN